MGGRPGRRSSHDDVYKHVSNDERAVRVFAVVRPARDDDDERRARPRGGTEQRRVPVEARSLLGVRREIAAERSPTNVARVCVSE